MTGHIVLGGATAASGYRLWVMFPEPRQREFPAVSGGSLHQLSPDGSFTIQDVTPGEVTLHVVHDFGGP